tara:strand:- start:751 stop:1281 length:531 start_codon:yes stop_codon:yes gene_type:complete
MALFVLASCDNDEEAYANYVESSIYSDDLYEDLSELLFSFSIKQSDSTYLAVDQLVDIPVYVDGELWSEGHTNFKDLSYFSLDTNGSVVSSSVELKYLLYASFLRPTVGFTAGSYADVLTSYRTLSNGDHFCEIPKISYTDLNGDTISIYPNLVQTFVVKPDQSQIHVADFQIQLN